MNFRLISLILLIHISGGLSLDLLTVTCEDKDVCALRENTVQLKCSYSEINIKTVFWFSRKQSSNWRKKDEPEDLTLDWDYSGRVKQEVINDHLTLIISDLRERDSGEYQLMIIMKDKVKRLGSIAVNLTVTDLQVKMNPATTDPRDQSVILTCGSSCDLTSRTPNYYWKKNGQYLKSRDNNKQINYRGTSFQTNETGSYSCSLAADYTNSSSPMCVSKSGCWDVIYTSRRVCALMGSTVDISCTYSHPSGTVKNTFWHYGRPGDFKDLREKHEFAGRVEYVGNTLRIKELKMSDSGEYRFRIITDTTEGTYSGTPGVILTVTDTMVKRSPEITSEILSCSTKCTLSDKHTYIWYKNGRQVTDGFTKDNKLYLDSVSDEELQEYSCAVEEITPNQEQSTALKITVITLSVILVLALIGVLWYRRRRNNSSQQHEERKDDVQTGSATLNDNAEPLYTVCTQDVKDQDVHYSTVSFKQSHIKDSSLAPTAVHSTSDDVHYASVNFSLPSV